jgi:hypothetical protein
MPLSRCRAGDGHRDNAHAYVLPGHDDVDVCELCQIRPGMRISY